MYRLPFSRLVLAAAMCCVVGMVTPTLGADATSALGEANKMMTKGAYVKAIDIINATLMTGKVPPELAGRAMLMRAQSQEKLGKAAFALADYNQALWMEGLSASDKKVAETGRARVQTGLGIKDFDGDTAEAAPKQTTGAIKPQTASTSESGGGGFFSNLFGGSSQKEERPQRAVVAVVQPEQAPKPAKVAAPKAAPVKTVKEARTVEPPKTVLAGSTATGEFAIQFAALYEEEKAIAEVHRIAKRYAGDLAGRSPSVVIVPTKDGGTLYKILAAPFPKAEGLAACEVLKSKKLNCMVISHKP